MILSFCSSSGFQGCLCLANFSLIRLPPRERPHPDRVTPWPPLSWGLLSSQEPFSPRPSSSEPSSQQVSSCPSPARSEEHTSELQSLMRISYAVFCLKNKTTKLIRIFATNIFIYTKTTKNNNCVR